MGCFSRSFLTSEPSADCGRYTRVNRSFSRRFSGAEQLVSNAKQRKKNIISARKKQFAFVL